MRAIQVSDAVYAKIWSLWKQGDSSEDQILQRVLDVKTDNSLRKGNGHLAHHPEGRGYFDKRHRVFFPEGFKIFRKEGTPAACAVEGGWLLDGRVYASVNQLSTDGLGIKSENAWINWFFRDEKGHVAPIDILRDRSTVASRTRKRRHSLFDLIPGDSPRSV